MFSSRPHFLVGRFFMGAIGSRNPALNRYFSSTIVVSDFETLGLAFMAVKYTDGDGRCAGGTVATAI
jgi:hypothetical protein